MGSLNCRKWNTIPVINSSLKGLFFPPASEESGSDCSITRCWRPLPTPQGDPGKRNQPGFFAQTPPATLPHREVFVDHHSSIPQHSARSFSPWRKTSIPQGEAVPPECPCRADPRSFGSLARSNLPHTQPREGEGVSCLPVT